MVFLGVNPMSRDTSFIYRSNEKTNSRNKNSNQNIFWNFFLANFFGGDADKTLTFLAILTAGQRTSGLTATVYGHTEEFQKNLRSNIYSVSDLEDPAEKPPLPQKKANAPTHCWTMSRIGQNSHVGYYRWGHWPFYAEKGVSLQQSSNQTQSKGLIWDFWDSSVLPCTLAVNKEVQLADCRNMGYVNVKRGDIFELPFTMVTELKFKIK